MAKKLSLDKMMGGALLAMFRREAGRLASNIWDRNTSATAKRSITIKLDIKPDDNREIGEISATVQSKLCPAKSIDGKFLFGLDSVGEGVASEYSADFADQLSIDDGTDTEDASENVVDLRNAGRKVV